MLRELSVLGIATRVGVGVPWLACNLVVSLPLHATRRKLQQTRKKQKFPACVRASRPRTEPYPTPRGCMSEGPHMLSEGPAMVAGDE